MSDEFGFHMDLDTGAVPADLGKVISRMRDPREGLQIIGESGVTSIRHNFEFRGRPVKWKPLAPETVKRKGHDRPLIEQGEQGGLKGDIHFEVLGPRLVVIGATKDYAPVHDQGADGKNIPARPFMLIQAKDWPRFLRVLENYVLRGKA